MITDRMRTVLSHTVEAGGTTAAIEPILTGTTTTWGNSRTSRYIKLKCYYISDCYINGMVQSAF